MNATECHEADRAERALDELRDAVSAYDEVIAERDAALAQVKVLQDALGDIDDEMRQANGGKVGMHEARQVWEIALAALAKAQRRN